MHKTGFTIVEIAIVLVIIGLVIGGVLVGRDLIETAKIGKQITQMHQFAQAVNLFKTKYNALPGDMYRNAPAFGFYQGNASGLRDNGIIDDQAGQSPILGTSYEPMYFFRHLAEANLMPRAFVQGANCYTAGAPGYVGYYPTVINPAAGMVATAWAGDDVRLYLGVSNCAAWSWIGGANANGIMTPQQAFGIDKKMDDGDPYRGIVMALRSDGSGYLIFDTTTNACVQNSASRLYNTGNTTYQCRLLIKL